jgi:hypothetical protein
MHYVLRSTYYYYALIIIISILIDFIWPNEELPRKCKESVNVPFHKKGDKTDRSYYRRKPLLLSTYKMLTNILLSMITPYVQLLRTISADFDILQSSYL